MSFFIGTKKEDILNAVFYNHFEDLKEQLGDSKKFQKVTKEDYSTEQSYMHNKIVDRFRTQFRMRTGMMDFFKDNYRAKHRTLERGEEERNPGFNVHIVRAKSTRLIGRHIAFGASHGQI